MEREDAEMEIEAMASTTLSLSLVARFEPMAENQLLWDSGAAPLAWTTRQRADLTETPATQDDIDSCSQDWRQHGPGWYECHDYYVNGVAQ